MESIKKIVIIGPESTGKSTLCERLSTYYHTLWVPEYARDYLERNGPAYTYEDLLVIAKGQIDSEEKFTEKMAKRLPGNLGVPPGLLFIDTDLYVMKVWAEFVFNRCHNWILDGIAERKYDLYLLCDTDLPWEKDALREYPDPKIRQRLLHYYKDLMVNQQVPWGIISGEYEERFQKAVALIDSLVT